MPLGMPKINILNETEVANRDKMELQAINPRKSRLLAYSLPQSASPNTGTLENSEWK